MLARKRAARKGGVFVGLELFAGLGGGTQGLEDAAAARGLTPTHTAVNHWRLACDSLEANHPRTRVICRNVFDLNPRQIIPGRRVRLLVAAPECIHHSKAARNGLELNDQSRSTAHAVPHYLEHLDVELLMVENVQEFKDWGPLHTDGPRKGRPVLELRGTIFQQWLALVEAYGLVCTWRIVDAADYGDATHRERFILLASRHGAVPFPKPTHGPGRKYPWNTIRPLLDLDLACPTVGRKRATGKLHSAATLERIAIGLRKFGGDPFIIRRPQHTNPPESDCRSVDWPLHTITANAHDIALITPHGRRSKDAGHRMLQVPELLGAMSLPRTYTVFGKRTEQIKQIGNAIPRRLAGAHIGALLDVA